MAPQKTKFFPRQTDIQPPSLSVDFQPADKTRIASMKPKDRILSWQIFVASVASVLNISSSQILIYSEELPA